MTQLVSLLHLLDRQSFVSTHDMQTLRGFVKAAEKTHKNLIYSKASDNLWSQYIMSLLEDLQPAKILAANIGKQPDDDVWVLGPDVFL